MIDLRVVRPLQPSIVAKKVHSDSVIPLPEVVCPNMGQHFSDENHDGSSGMRMVRPSAAFLSTAGFEWLRRVSRRAFNSVNEASTSSYITQDLQSLMKVLPYMDYTSLYPEIMRVISTATLGQEVASRL